MIYFDNAATTFPKPKCVIDSVYECLSSYCGNPGRASHTLSKRAAEAVYDTREKIANFLNIQRPESVVFTYNATYELNLALKTLITEKCHVITSDIEHNSVIRPLEKLKRTLDINYTLFNSDGDIEKNIIKEIRPHTRCIVSTLASNVTGKAIPLNILSKVSKEYGLTLIIDASQWIGHNQVDLTETPCDVFCAPGHKALFGIQGCGFAVFKESRIKESFIEGGSGYESESIHMPSLLPEGYEAGTLSVPAIVSLGAGIDFINSATISDINSKIASISSFLKKGLSKIDNIILYPSFGSTIAFNHRNYYSNSMSELLDNDGFCVRAGLHCAPSAHKKIGTLDHGCVRLSFSYFNTEDEASFFLEKVKKI